MKTRKEMKAEYRKRVHWSRSPSYILGILGGILIIMSLVQWQPSFMSLGLALVGLGIVFYFCWDQIAMRLFRK